MPKARQKSSSSIFFCLMVHLLSQLLSFAAILDCSLIMPLAIPSAALSRIGVWSGVFFLFLNSMVLSFLYFEIFIVKYAPLLNQKAVRIVI